MSRVIHTADQQHPSNGAKGLGFGGLIGWTSILYQRVGYHAGLS
jgi:hypothetical protein